MATAERIPVATGILEWARRTAGYGVSQAAKKLVVKEERLRSWESGELAPTVVQLRNMAKLYKRPLAVLLLPAPPKDFDALRDFRRTGEPGSHDWTPALHAEYKRALTQREVLREIGEISPASLQGAQGSKIQLSLDMDPEDAGAELRRFLGVDSWKSGMLSNPAKALRSAIDAVEGYGISVLQTRDVDIAEMRGFSISEWPHPIVVLNGADWPRPKLFTLLHELSHLGLNAGGLCDLHEPGTSTRDSDENVERFCNRVAASALMPRALILSDPAVKRVREWTLQALSEVSARYGASAEALLLRLVTLRLVDWDEYRRMKPLLDSVYARLRKAEKEKQRASEGGPPYYLVKARNLGRGYVESVLDAYHSRAISSYDVADYLDIKYDQLPKLQEAVLR
ncbi:ImmA/IrrE family metallo-endopeptidase [Streptomyces sp. f51]|uniref:ImmA/IrrE family metallo-endopeptidase n=1 Tax=Streptomyces sp. f51 TaxID=1827742 RepID=UPI000BF1CB51|nr:ImmA/IrrE family metallo-endopeptidase [Streptomyces sp. f51]